MQFRGCGDDGDDLRNVLFAHVVVRQSQDFDDSIDVPLLCARILLTNLANLVRQLFFKIGVCSQEVVGQFFHDGLNVLCVRDFVK